MARSPLARLRWAAAVVRSVARWTRALAPWMPDRPRAWRGALALLARDLGLPVGAPRYELALPGSRHELRIGTWHELACVLEVLRADDYIQPGLRPRRVLDLGANIGAATLQLRDRYPGAELVAVEPAADTYALLEANVGALDGVRCRRLAVGPRGRVRLDPEVEPTARQPEAAGADDRDAVDRIPLGALLDELGWAEADLVKIDIEGDEFAVLADAEAMARCGAVVGELHLHKAPEGFDPAAVLPGSTWSCVRATRRATSPSAPCAAPPPPPEAA